MTEIFAWSFIYAAMVVGSILLAIILFGIMNGD